MQPSRSRQSPVLCLLFFASSLTAPAAARTWLVPGDAPTIAGGLSAAASGDTVLVACGTYFERNLIMKGGVTLRGETGDPACVTIDAGHLGRVIDCNNVHPRAFLEGLTIRGGQTSDGWLDASGGGVRCMNSELSVSHCVFTENDARIGGGMGIFRSAVDIADALFLTNSSTHYDWGAGGGIWARETSGSVTDCTFTGNTAFSSDPTSPGDGGGLFCNLTTLAVTRCNFFGNSTGAGAGAYYSVSLDAAVLTDCYFEGNSGTWGGACYFEHGSVAALHGCTFIGNTAHVGGALQIDATSLPTLTDCVFENNHATRGTGGAVQCWPSTPNFVRCTFRGNTSVGVGGGIFVGGADPLIQDCTFEGNSSASYGGAVACRNAATPRFERCLMSGNSATIGGAIHAANNTNGLLVSCTLVGNSAAGGGGGVACQDATLAFEKSIIAHSTAGEAVALLGSGSASFSCSDIYGNAGGDWVGPIAAQFGLLHNFSLEPCFCDATSGVFTLCDDSPCLPGSLWGCGELIGALDAGCSSCGCIGGAMVSILPQASGPLNCSQVQRVTFRYSGDEAAPAVKGYSVTVECSPSVVFGPEDVAFMMVPASTTLYDAHVTELIPGSKYLIDYAVLLPVNTGFTGTEDLFTIDLHPAGDGEGAVSIVAMSFRDLVNQEIMVTSGGPATMVIDCTAPAAASAVAIVTGPSGLAAAPDKQKITVSWEAPSSWTGGSLYEQATAVEVWRAMWHRAEPTDSAYPEYDDWPDAVVPTRPDAYGDWRGEWTLVATLDPSATSWVDVSMAQRGVYYYEVFATDGAGNWSFRPEVGGGGATSYWLGDVHDGLQPGAYDGLVLPPDVTLLGACFGSVAPAGSLQAEVDVGPTDDGGARGIPMTDNQIDFEDLMIFAINFNHVNKAGFSPAAGDRVRLVWRQLDDLTWSLELAAASASLKGVRLTAALPHGAQATVIPGALLGQQGTPTFLQNSERLGLDLGLAVLGEGRGVQGTGELCRVTLTMAADLTAAVILARGLVNEPLAVDLTTPVDALPPQALVLHQNAPNPFNPITDIAFEIPETGRVRLTVHTVNGRLVAILADEARTAGRHHVTWEGRDVAGRPVASGSYFCRLEAAGAVRTIRLSLVR